MAKDVALQLSKLHVSSHFLSNVNSGVIAVHLTLQFHNLKSWGFKGVGEYDGETIIQSMYYSRANISYT